MAFDRNSAAASNASSNQGPNNDSWKAQGFLNFYLPSKNGSRRKLGAIALKSSKANEKQLLDWLTEDPARVSVILSKLDIDFQSTAPNEATAFALED